MLRCVARTSREVIVDVRQPEDTSVSCSSFLVTSMKMFTGGAASIGAAATGSQRKHNPKQTLRCCCLTSTLCTHANVCWFFGVVLPTPTNVAANASVAEVLGSTGIVSGLYAPRKSGKLAASPLHSSHRYSVTPSHGKSHVAINEVRADRSFAPSSRVCSIRSRNGLSGCDELMSCQPQGLSSLQSGYRVSKSHARMALRYSIG